MVCVYCIVVWCIVLYLYCLVVSCGCLVLSCIVVFLFVVFCLVRCDLFVACVLRLCWFDFVLLSCMVEFGVAFVICCVGLCLCVWFV